MSKLRRILFEHHAHVIIITGMEWIHKQAARDKKESTTDAIWGSEVSRWGGAGRVHAMQHGED